jgi:hypothetical protein
MQGSCQHWCTPFFWTLPYANCPAKMHSSVAALFCAGRTPATPGMRTALRVGAGMDDSQSVELRDHAGMAVTVLTLQQCWIALPGLAMMRAAAEICTLRRMGRAQRNPSPSRAAILMGIAALHPSYKLGSLAIRFAREAANSDCQVDFVLEAHFRLKSDIAPCSFRAPRAERFPPTSRMRH